MPKNFDETHTFEATKVEQPGLSSKLVNLEVNGCSFSNVERNQAGGYASQTMSYAIVWHAGNPWKVWWWDDDLARTVNIEALAEEKVAVAKRRLQDSSVITDIYSEAAYCVLFRGGSDREALAAVYSAV